MTRYTWFYSFESPISGEMETKLEGAFARFLQQWNTHGTPVQGGIRIAHAHFVIIRSDPTDARPSGCSIDSMKKGVEDILKQHGLGWAEAGNVFYLDETKQVKSANFREIQTLVAAGQLKADTLIFDHTLSQTDDLNKWEVRLGDSWMRRYLPTSV